MCTKLLDWFNNEFLFMFESKKFKKNNSNKLHHNIKIIIDEHLSTKSTEPTKSIDPTESIEPNESNESNEPKLESKDEYDLYTWDIL